MVYVGHGLKKAAAFLYCPSAYGRYQTVLWHVGKAGLAQQCLGILPDMHPYLCRVAALDLYTFAPSLPGATAGLQPTREAWEPPLRIRNPHTPVSTFPAKAPVIAFADSMHGCHLPPPGARVRQGPGHHSAAHATLPILGRDNNATDATAVQERYTACHVHGTNPKPSC